MRTLTFGRRFESYRPYPDTQPVVAQRPLVRRKLPCVLVQNSRYFNILRRAELLNLWRSRDVARIFALLPLRPGYVDFNNH